MVKDEKNNQSRHWCFTFNNYDHEGEDLLSDYTYMIYGKEVGEQGTNHLQGYVCFEDRKRLTGVKKQNPKMHWEIKRGTVKQAIDYCKKDGNFVEFGEVPPEQTDNATKKRKEEFAQAIDLAKKGKIDEIDPELQTKYYRTYELIASRNLEVEATVPMNNFWIYGPAGVGKSKSVREKYPDLYVKNLNKWWDNYRGQEVVLIEDIDPNHREFMLHFLKIWADHYKFQAEFKGGSKEIRPKKIFVTSNYSIDDIFGNNEPLHRRFKEIFYENSEKNILEDI